MVLSELFSSVQVMRFARAHNVWLAEMVYRDGATPSQATNINQ